MEPLRPTGFWSYTRDDDDVSAGRLRQLRASLTAELQARLGRNSSVRMFQDVATIPNGPDWDRAVGEALDLSSFFIPVITPWYLQSRQCCEEVMRFRAREIELGRTDLIFPIHYIHSDIYDTGRVEECAVPEVLRTLRSRQWINFRDINLYNPYGADVRSRISALADSVWAALSRTSADTRSWGTTRSPVTATPGVDNNGYNLHYLLRERTVTHCILVGATEKGALKAVEELQRRPPAAVTRMSGDPVADPLVSLRNIDPEPPVHSTAYRPPSRTAEAHAGRETVQRMLGAERQSTAPSFWPLTTALLSLGGVAIVSWMYWREVVDLISSLVQSVIGQESLPPNQLTAVMVAAVMPHPHDDPFRSAAFQGANPGIHGDAAVPAVVPAADWLDMSVFAPEKVALGDEVLVQVLLHSLPNDVLAAEDAVAADPGTSRRGIRTLALKVANGDRIDVGLEARGVTIDEPTQNVTWVGQLCSVQFGVSVPLDYAFDAIQFRVRAYLNSVPIGVMRFSMMIVKSGIEKGRLMIRGESAVRYQRAFMSYSSQDRSTVLRYAHALHLAGVSVRQDILMLNPGDRWARQLFKEIDDCDIVLLFWSSNAAASEWVRKEVDYALVLQNNSNHEEPEVKPVIIEGPPIPDPPESWSHIHFNDPFHYIMLGIDQETQARSNSGAPDHTA